jgi:hypothetical protein
MHKFAEHAVLLRAQAELPVSLKLATDPFHDGWKFVRTGDAQRLQRKIEKQGWQFIAIADGALRSGVGDSAQAALASAVRLALRRVSVFFNAVEVRHVQITSYPWFFLARIVVNPYRIQQAPVAPVPDRPMPPAIHPRQRPLPPYALDPFPQFGGGMPLLRELLTAPRNPGASIQ